MVLSGEEYFCYVEVRLWPTRLQGCIDDEGVGSMTIGEWKRGCVRNMVRKKIFRRCLGTQLADMYFGVQKLELLCGNVLRGQR